MSLDELIARLEIRNDPFIAQEDLRAAATALRELRTEFARCQELLREARGRLHDDGVYYLNPAIVERTEDDLVLRIDAALKASPPAPQQERHD
jgi:hypothetical protein